LITSGRRTHGEAIRSFFPLLFALAGALLAGCMAQHGRASDRILGLVLLDGTEQPIAGASLTLTPTAPLPQGRVDAWEPDPLPVARAPTGDSGAFAFDGLTGPDGAPVGLLRGWEYVLRADAPGFFTTTEELEYAGGERALLVTIEVVDEEVVHGDGGLFVDEQAPDRLPGVEGTLIKEVLRRLGREGPDGRPTQ
jgi:hypothetical protein